MEHAMKRWHYIRNGSSLKLDSDRCIGCSACLQVCPHQVFGMQGRKAQILDRDACMECGACARNCPVQALQVQPGVGCVAAILIGKLRGTAPTCECGGSKGGACC